MTHHSDIVRVTDAVVAVTGISSTDIVSTSRGNIAAVLARDIWIFLLIEYGCSSDDIAGMLYSDRPRVYRSHLRAAKRASQDRTYRGQLFDSHRLATQLMRHVACLEESA